MRALKAAVMVMGVLIVVGVVTLGVLLTRRLSGVGGEMASTLLDEPAGSRIGAISAMPDRLAVQLQGGGPDRVLIVDTRSGKVTGRVSLAR